MGFMASDKGGTDFEMTPEGQYVARCFKMVDMGTQTSTGQFGTKEQHKIMVSWELLEEPYMADGRPFSVSQFYTVSLHEKAKLRADLESWRGRKFSAAELEGFDLSSVVGAYCMIQVVHSEDGKYANVQTIMAYKGDKPKPVNPDVLFDIDDPDMDIFAKFSENMQQKIASAPEWNKNKPGIEQTATAQATKADTVVDPLEGEKINLDDIPFSQELSNSLNY